LTPAKKARRPSETGAGPDGGTPDAPGLSDLQTYGYLVSERLKRQLAILTRQIVAPTCAERLGDEASGARSDRGWHGSRVAVPATADGRRAVAAEIYCPPSGHRPTLNGTLVTERGVDADRVAPMWDRALARHAEAIAAHAPSSLRSPVASTASQRPQRSWNAGSLR
jgi:hypothetical protein